MKIFKKYLKNKNKNNVPEIWDSVWSKRTDNPPHPIVISSIKKLTNIKNILEVGGGSGSDIIELSKDYDVTYSDYSNVALKKFQDKTNGKIKIQMADAKKLPFKDNSFDLVFCLGLLEHFSDKDKQKIIYEMKRISRKYVLIDVPQKYSIHILLKKIVMLMGKWQYGYEEELSFYELNNMLKNNGLKVVDYYGRELIPIPRKYKIKDQVINTPKLFAKFGCGCFGIISKK